MSHSTSNRQGCGPSVVDSMLATIACAMPQPQRRHPQIHAGGGGGMEGVQPKPIMPHKWFTSQDLSAKLGSSLSEVAISS